MKDQCELAEARLALRYSMMDLTPHQRRCVDAYFKGSSAIAELAVELGISVQAVHANCHIAYPKMRKRLEELGIHSFSDLLSNDDFFDGRVPQKASVSF